MAMIFKLYFFLAFCLSFCTENLMVVNEVTDKE